MRLRLLRDKVLGWIGAAPRSAHSLEAKPRGAQTHVIVLDGTMSSLERGRETHAGALYRLCHEMRPRVSVFYEAGIQWQSWEKTPDVVMGRGINRQIRRAYGYLASRYRPGDRIFLIGYSRGAYAVRSLAGVIDLVGLLKVEHANTRNIRTVYRHYQLTPHSTAAAVFKDRYCHSHTPIEMVGVWDTVKALGFRLPIVWRFVKERHAFHNHCLGRSIRNGYHALAMNESRRIYEPVMWEDEPGFPGHVEQVWFKGSHGDVGGQLGTFEAARPLSNLSLVWMLEKAEGLGLPLPDNWRARIFTDPAAPSTGTWRGWAKIFFMRRKRRIGRYSSERLHPTAVDTAPPESRYMATEDWQSGFKVSRKV
ncbi:MAG: DUF2235 domain-containing protein [Paracoccaceae bacterium]